MLVRCVLCTSYVHVIGYLCRYIVMHHLAIYVALFSCQEKRTCKFHEFKLYANLCNITAIILCCGSMRSRLVDMLSFLLQTVNEATYFLEIAQLYDLVISVSVSISYMSSLPASISIHRHSNHLYTSRTVKI